MPYETIRSRRDTDYEQLVAGAPPCFKSFYLPEPKLVFANGQLSADAKEGLTLYGPANIGGKTPRTIRVVTPCNMFHPRKLGHIREGSISQILNSGPAETFRQSHKQDAYCRNCAWLGGDA